MRMFWMYILIAILMTPIFVSAQTETNLVDMPNLIGVMQDDANVTLSNYNLTPNYHYQYNDEFGREEIFWQEYTANKKIVSGKIVSISVSLGPHRVNIETPKKDELVKSFVIVKGNTSPSFSQEDLLWIVVNPLNSSENYWPQSGGPLLVDNDGTFNGVAFLGGEKNDSFNVVVVVVNETLSGKFSAWVKACSARNNWPPITEEGEGYETVSKTVINNHKGDSVLVILNE